MSSDDKRDLYKGLDDGWAGAMELALTPVVAGGIGYLIDHLAGTMPVFTIVLVVMAVVTGFIKLYYAYDSRMRALDAAAPWGRRKDDAPDDGGQV